MLKLNYLNHTGHMTATVDDPSVISEASKAAEEAWDKNIALHGNAYLKGPDGVWTPISTSTPFKELKGEIDLVGPLAAG